MTLYVSNPSRQTVEFFYRREKVPRGMVGVSSPASITIPPGGQVALGQRWSPEETRYVIEQILYAGGADAEITRTGKQITDGFTGLLYQEVNPIETDEIFAAHESIMAHAQARSVEVATEAAMSFDNIANSIGGRQGNPQRIAKQTMVEVREDLAPGQRQTADTTHFQMTVDPDGTTDLRGLRGLR